MLTDCKLRRGCKLIHKDTRREERRLWVFENRVLRTVFGPKRDEVTGSGKDCIMRSLMICTHTPNIDRVIISRIRRWVGHVARMGERRSIYRDLLGQPE